MSIARDRLLARFEPILDRLEPVVEKIESTLGRVDPQKLSTAINHVADLSSHIRWWLTTGRQMLFWLMILFVILILANIFLIVRVGAFNGRQNPYMHEGMS